MHCRLHHHTSSTAWMTAHWPEQRQVASTSATRAATCSATPMIAGDLSVRSAQNGAGRNVPVCHGHGPLGHAYTHSLGEGCGEWPVPVANQLAVVEVACSR